MDDSRRKKIETLLDLHRVDDAQEQLMSLAAENPDDAWVFGQMCRCHLIKGEHGKALEQANKVVANLPDSGWGHYLRGICLSNMDIHPSKADEAFREALSNEPYEPAYYGAFAAHMLDSSKQEEALELAEKGLALDPEHEQCQIVRMAVASIRGKKGEAADIGRGLLGDSPDSPDVHAQVGWTALRAGDHKQARGHFCTALNLDPEHNNARVGLVTSIKATNPVYRLLLGWIFLCQRLGNYALVVIFGIIIIRRTLGEISEANPELAMVLQPVSWLLGLFVLLTWVGDPVANFLLLLHPDGRHALTPQQKWSSSVVFGCLAGALALAIMGLSGKSDFTVQALILASFSILASAGLTHDFKEKQARTSGFMALGVFVLGLAALFLGGVNPGLLSLYLLAFIGFTWFGGILSVVRR